MQVALRGWIPRLEITQSLALSFGRASEASAAAWITGLTKKQLPCKSHRNPNMVDR